MPLPYYELAYDPRAERWTLTRHDPPQRGGAVPPPVHVGTYADVPTLAHEWTRLVAPWTDACQRDTLDESAP